MKLFTNMINVDICKYDPNCIISYYCSNTQFYLAFYKNNVFKFGFFKKSFLKAKENKSATKIMKRYK